MLTKLMLALVVPYVSGRAGGRPLDRLTFRYEVTDNDFEEMKKHITHRFTQLDNMLTEDSDLVVVIGEELFGGTWEKDCAVNDEHIYDNALIHDHIEEFVLKLEVKYQNPASTTAPGQTPTSGTVLGRFYVGKIGDAFRKNNCEIHVFGASARNWNSLDASYLAGAPGARPLRLMKCDTPDAAKFSTQHHRFGTFGVVTSPEFGTSDLFRSDPDHDNYVKGDWKKRSPAPARNAAAAQAIQAGSNMTVSRWLGRAAPLIGATVILSLLAIVIRLVY